MNSMLERFYRAKQPEIEFLRQLAQKGELPQPFTGHRPSFLQALALRRPAVIAEYKRASPSRGSINLGLEPEEAAAQYAAAGAACLSVLTESEYFKGDLGFLQRMTGPGLPLLRKDFIFTAGQVTATAATPASALLLIVRMLDADTLKSLIALSADFGIVPVVEIFDEADLLRARAAGATVIQVNNRDLDTLRVDCQTSVDLVAGRKAGEVWISASGIGSAGQLASLLGCGFDAALVGSSLMGSADSPGAALQRLLEG